MSIVDTAKDIYDLAKKGVTIDLQERLMGLREEAMSLQEENLKLRKRIQELEEQATLREELVFDGNLYWRKVGENKEGPFCQKCYDNDRKLVRLQDARRLAAARDWLCFVCKAGYGKGY
jgi:hypothetical protein